MGMDVYVGPLTRYLLGEWLTVVQQAGMANGVQVQVLRPQATGPSDPAEVQARNARLAASPEAPIARFDWIWSYDVERAMANG